MISQISGFICEVKESYGFLKYICTHRKVNSRRTWYKCTNKEENYYAFSEYGDFYGSFCSNDPHFYQICGTVLSGKVTNSDLLCEYYICKHYSVLYSSDALSSFNGEVMQNARTLIGTK